MNKIILKDIFPIIHSDFEIYHNGKLIGWFDFKDKFQNKKTLMEFMDYFLVGIETDNDNIIAVAITD